MSGVSSLREKRLMRKMMKLKESKMTSSITEDIKDGGTVEWKITVDSDGVGLPAFLDYLTIILRFGHRFPFQPPEVLICDIFHPNVYPNSRLCMSLLDTEELPGGPGREAQWRVSLGITSVLYGALNVLREPCPESGANLEAARLYISNKDDYIEKNLELLKRRQDRRVIADQDKEFKEMMANDKEKEDKRIEEAAVEKEKVWKKEEKQAEDARKEKEKQAEDARKEKEKLAAIELARSELPPEPSIDGDAQIIVISTAAESISLDIELNRRLTFEDVAFTVYADPGFAVGSSVITHFSTRTYTEEERNWNRAMSRGRISVEWSFGRVKTLWKRLTYKDNLKTLMSPTAIYWFTAVHLTNLHSCFYGSQVNRYFGMEKPTLESYLS